MEKSHFYPELEVALCFYLMKGMAILQYQVNF